MTTDKPAHSCPEWDYLHIKPGDPEMEACTCEFPSQPEKEQEVE